MNVVEGCGNSMSPTIRDGERVIFSRTSRVSLGAIGVFPDVVHRIVRIEPGGALWEKGEALAAWPRRRRPEELQGIAVAVIRNGSIVDLDTPPSRLTLAWSNAQTRLHQRSLAARLLSASLRVALRAYARARRPQP